MIGPTAAGAVALRPAVDGDEPFLRGLDGLVVADRLGLAGLPDDVRAPLLALQFTARRRDRASSFPDAVEQVIMLGDEPVGALTVDRSPARLLVVDIALVPAARRQGIAAAVVRAFTEEADRDALPLRATAHTDNVASRRLLAAAGLDELDDDGMNVSLERPARASRSG